MSTSQLPSPVTEWNPILCDKQSFGLLRAPVRKSDRDEREYRLVRLDNGMQILVISDPDVDKAAASLEVCVGHLSDPVCGMECLAIGCVELVYEEK